MVTFTKESLESVNNLENGHHHQHHYYIEDHNHVPLKDQLRSTSQESVVSKSQHYYEQATAEENEYSEYCVPNCESIEDTSSVQVK